MSNMKWTPLAGFYRLRHLAEGRRGFQRRGFESRFSEMNGFGSSVNWMTNVEESLIIKLRSNFQGTCR